jgi:hypothetical protein
MADYDLRERVKTVKARKYPDLSLKILGLGVVVIAGLVIANYRMAAFVLMFPVLTLAVDVLANRNWVEEDDNP